MRLAFVLLALCAFVPREVTTQPAKRSPSLVDLLNIPRIDDPQLSPDGGRVAFQIRTTDWRGNRRVPQVWQINIDGTGLRRMTSVEAGAAMPRWSPDGTTLAFLSRGQIWTVPAEGGDPRQVSRHQTPAGDIAWHPDGSAIFFLAAEVPSPEERDRQRMRGDIRVVDEYRRRHLWKVSIAGNETRVTEGGDHVSSFRLDARGERLLLSRRPSPLPAHSDQVELWSSASDGRSAVRLTHNRIQEGLPELSPDGTQVLFLARANQQLEPYYNANVFLVPATGGQARAPIPDFPYEVLRALWSADGRSVWMVVNMGVHSQLFTLDPQTGTTKQLTEGEHATVEGYWDVVGDRHVFAIDETTRLGDLWTWRTGETSPRQVTRVYDYLNRDLTLPRQERVEWKGADGVAVEGVLTYPVGYVSGKRYPLIVQLHGGPEASDRFGWGSVFFYYQPVWAARGYAILRPNYRGSSGYGNAFYREPIGGYFKQSHRDVLAGVDRVIELGVADPERMAVMGWSAGGHLVNKLITFTHRFKAAASGAGVANWISLYGTSDTRTDRDLWLGGSLWQRNPPLDTYWEHSPLKYVTAARTPTLFFAGENDARVPPSQAVEMSRALRAQDVASEVHIAPGEGHDWVQPIHQLYKMNAELAWIEKLVRGVSPALETVPAQNDASVVPIP